MRISSSRLLKRILFVGCFAFLSFGMSACQKIQVDYALTEEPEDAPEYTVEAQQNPTVKTQ